MHMCFKKHNTSTLHMETLCGINICQINISDENKAETMSQTPAVFPTESNRVALHAPHISITLIWSLTLVWYYSMLMTQPLSVGVYYQDSKVNRSVLFSLMSSICNCMHIAFKISITVSAARNVRSESQRVFACL